MKLQELQKRNMKFRPSFGIMMAELLSKREDVVFVVADSARACRFKMTEEIASRVVDCGIAEQNMIGVSAGLARGGKKPVAFAFSPFASERCFEQIKLDVAYSNLNVVIVGSEAGIGMGTQGVTHYGWEDIGVISSLPNMTIVSPADHLEMYKCMEAALQYDGPVYIRLSGGVPKSIYKKDYDFQVGKSIRVREGKDVCIFAVGTMVATALEAAELLEEEQIDASVVNMHTIKPLDEKAVLDAANNCKGVVSLEEHSIINGLGSAIANVLAQASSGVKFLKLALPDSYPQTVSPYGIMLEDFGLTSKQVAETIKKRMLL
ncbi:MAG: transketolase [Clostridiales bacterium]|nr:transketolase [Clostridiales bacterium]